MAQSSAPQGWIARTILTSIPFGICLTVTSVTAWAQVHADEVSAHRPPAYTGRVVQDRSVVDMEAAAWRTPKVVPVSTATQVAPPHDPDEPLFRDLLPTEAGGAASATQAAATAHADRVNRADRAAGQYVAPKARAKAAHLKDGRATAKAEAGPSPLAKGRAVNLRRAGHARSDTALASAPKARHAHAKDGGADGKRTRAERQASGHKATGKAVRHARAEQGAKTETLAKARKAGHAVKTAKPAQASKAAKVAKARTPRETVSQASATRSVSARHGAAAVSTAARKVKVAGAAKPSSARRSKAGASTRQPALPARRTVVRHATGAMAGGAGPHLLG